MSYTPQQRRNHIFQLQKFLFTISIYNRKIPSVIPDGIYGKTTALAVRAFQSENNLNVTGETDGQTWNKIVAVYRNYTENNEQKISLFQDNAFTYGKGDEGFEVSVIQSGLAELGKKFSNMQKLNVTGIFDNQTYNAVINFQNRMSIEKSGRVDVETWNAIVGALN
jgi:peptidoglycan hydrolase-like protein with peptidoglycan-binding domain